MLRLLRELKYWQYKSLEWHKGSIATTNAKKSQSHIASKTSRQTLNTRKQYFWESSRNYSRKFDSLPEVSVYN